MGMNKKKMNEDEMMNFIRTIDHFKMCDGLEQSENDRKGSCQRRSLPDYVKGIRAALIALDYDDEWVYTELMHKLEEKYL